MSGEEVKMKQQKFSMNWIAVLWYIHINFLGFYGLWIAFTEAHWMTVLFAIFTTLISCIGVTVVAHRYYAHRTFSATTPLRFFFIIAHTLAGVGPVYNWVLLHRMHHKYLGTDKDPYNFNKGFIYAHFISNCKDGYLEDAELVKTIDMRDIGNEGFVWVQQKFYWVLFVLITLLFPINVPMAYWDESILNSFVILIILRLAIVSNVSWLVNSAVLIWGLKPTDKFPVEDFSVYYVNKSYWPKYHYIFPRDWKSSEFGCYDAGSGTMLIKLWHELGLVNNLMTMSSENAREALYKIASKKISVKDAVEEIEELSIKEAIQQELQYKH